MKKNFACVCIACLIILSAPAAAGGIMPFQPGEPTGFGTTVETVGAVADTLPFELPAELKENSPLTVSYGFSEGFLIVSVNTSQADLVEICLNETLNDTHTCIGGICRFKYNSSGNFSERMISEDSLRKINNPVLLTVTVRKTGERVEKIWRSWYDRFFYLWQ